MPGFRAFYPLLTGTLLALPVAAHAEAEFFGPVPYLSAADTPPGFATGLTFIEDFEDNSVDRRLRRSSSSIVPPGGITDSVDADDGAIDGSGSNGHSLFGSSIRIDFEMPFPTSTGMVWTDGAASNVTFEAFGPSGESLGSIGPFMLGDGSISGTTDEDRFFGVRDAEGVSAIRFISGAVMEIDHIQFDVPVEPVIMSTLHDGDAAILLSNPGSTLPDTLQQSFALGDGARPHGLAFHGGRHALFADFDQPLLYRAAIATPTSVQPIALQHRTSGSGSLAVEPNGRYALSIGQSAGGLGEAVVIDFGTSPPTQTAIPGGLRVLPFVTAAVDFAPDGRAFVCHVNGVSVLRRPYTQIDFTIPFPPTLQSPTMCRLSPNGQRLFVTRMLSETEPSINGVRTTTAPFSAGSVFTVMPAPPDVQGLGPMAVSPGGDALIVGQQFLFPQAPNPPRARAFLLRAPFDGTTEYHELDLPAEATGVDCEDQGLLFDCSGFEHIEINADGTLAILTGNSNRLTAGTAEAVPAVFIEQPFDDLRRQSRAMQVSPDSEFPGRGSGGIRFRPDRIFLDGFGTP